MSGIFYGVGVGPGEPELMTLKAVRVMCGCDVVAAPGADARESTAYRIAVQAAPQIADKPLLALPMPMRMDRDALERCHREGAALVAARLDAGEDVAFLTLGDPSLYSTFGYLRRLLAREGYAVRAVPGVTACAAAAAALGTSLAEWDEPLHILPARHLADGFRPESGAYALMKPPKRVDALKAALRDSGWSAQAVVNCGMPGEKVFADLDDLPDAPGYYTIILVNHRD